MERASWMPPAAAPTTPDSNATSLGHVSDEDELLPSDYWTFEIRLFSGRSMTCRFDYMTSVGWALRQALDNEAWFDPRHGPPPECILVKGIEPVKFVQTKLCDLFDGYEEGERVLSLVPQTVAYMRSSYIRRWSTNSWPCVQGQG